MSFMSEYSFQPSVDQVQEFIEIAGDFSNPLDLVREAISNSVDAHARSMTITFDVMKEYGENVLVITLQDDGQGMDSTSIKSFFDLGNSTNRNNPDAIGEKGHGTKVYFNSSEVQVETIRNDTLLVATMGQPYKNLFNRELPNVSVKEHPANGKPTGTTIRIKGYNNNRREKFTHEILKDYIQWFTKLGSFESYFNGNKHGSLSLKLKGLNTKEHEPITFGHPFPDESENIDQLFDKYLVDAPHHYCKQILKSGQLPNHPEVGYRALFSIEGNKVKRDYNPMLRRSGYTAPPGAYTVQERYGIWLCKDFIPVQRANEWISVRGTEYTRFHAFFNCQEFKLTANRGSVNNTASELLKDIEQTIREIFDSITNSDDWRDMEWLESQAEAHRSTEREKRDFEYRIKRFNKSNVAQYKGIDLAEPSHESGVFGLVMSLSSIEPTIFPFAVVDYNTYTSIDVIAKGDRHTAIHRSKLFYVELKFFLGKQLNHSFENLHSIVCWDTEVKHGDVVIDINGEDRRMHIISPAKAGDYTSYFLEHPKRALKIEVFVLKDYLKERYGIEFRPRASSDLAEV
jgi:hypothetical protein